MPITTEELIKEACPLIRDHGWAYYFAPTTAARAEKLGLDLLSFYVMGRGGVLGDVEWPVVQSVFAYFKPDLIRDAWTAGKAIIDPRTAGRAYVESCHEYGRLKLAGVDGLDAFCNAAAAVNDAVEVAGLTLYAAARSEPLAEDAPARAMQLVAVLREFRGSAHLVALTASGVSAKEAHYINRPEAMALFGWSEGEEPAVTDEHRRLVKEAEALTDRLVTPAYSVLDEDGRAAMLDGIRAVSAALTS